MWFLESQNHWKDHQDHLVQPLAHACDCSRSRHSVRYLITSAYFVQKIYQYTMCNVSSGDAFYCGFMVCHWRSWCSCLDLYQPTGVLLVREKLVSRLWCYNEYSVALGCKGKVVCWGWEELFFFHAVFQKHLQWVVFVVSVVQRNREGKGIWEIQNCAFIWFYSSRCCERGPVYKLEITHVGTHLYNF